MRTAETQHVIIGTAGHIDHGKTALVRRLTGVDTDRLPEEKRRGITIVLGFAPLVFPDGTRAGVIDVPGHERFVKNMVAGAGGVDVALLVVAADEGVMPQTREHIEICELLGLASGMIALTKVDRAGRELVELAVADVREAVSGTFLQDAPIIPVSSLTGEGIPRLVSALEARVREAKARGDARVLLPIDRVFSMKGFGSVITGTLVSGTLAIGDRVHVLPAVGRRATAREARIRGLQVFREPVERAFSGQRTAVNLHGLELSELEIGQVIVTPGAARATDKLAVELLHLASRTRPLESGRKVLLHTGTTQVEARVSLVGRDTLEPGARGFAKITSRRPIAALSGQRFILRGFEATGDGGRTLGGGVVLDPEPGRRKRTAPATVDVMTKLRDARTGNDAGLEDALVALVAERGATGIDLAALARRLGIGREKATETIDPSTTLISLGDRVYVREEIEGLSRRIEALVETFHRARAYAAGISLVELSSRIGRGVRPEVIEAAVALGIERRTLTKDEGGVRRRADAGAEGRDAAERKILGMLEDAGLEPPSLAELEARSGLTAKAFKDVVATLVKAKAVVLVSRDFYVARRAFDEAADRALEHLRREGSMSTAQAKSLFGVSRKYLIPLLESLDRARVTVRVGDLRRAATSR